MRSVKIRIGFSTTIPPTHYRTSVGSRGLVVFVVLMCASYFSVAQADWYRWKTPDGGVHYGDSMPSSQAIDGYDLIDPKTGEVIRHIDRARTPKELAEIAAAKRAAEKKQQAEQARADNDRALLDLYSNTSDLERAKAQRLEEIDGLITQTENAIGRATHRQKNTPIASERQAALQDLLQLNRNLLDLQELRNKTTKQFDEDLLRFKQLKTKNKSKQSDQ